MIQLENVSKIYQTGKRNVVAVSDVCLQLLPGTITAVLGKSGSGKSTLLHIIGGFLKPTKGNVWWNGQDLYALEDKQLSVIHNKEIGVVPQGGSALAGLNVIENVMLPALVYQSEESREQLVERTKQLLERFDILELADELPRNLSGGELKRVSIARAFINQPKILLCDEPTGDLDAENTKIVMKVLREIADSGTIVFMVTHEPDTLTYVDHIFKMEQGKLIQTASQ